MRASPVRGLEDVEAYRRLPKQLRRVLVQLCARARLIGRYGTPPARLPVAVVAVVGAVWHAAYAAHSGLCSSSGLMHLPGPAARQIAWHGPMPSDGAGLPPHVMVRSGHLVPTLDLPPAWHVMEPSRHFVPSLHLPSPGRMVKPSGHLVPTLHLEPPGRVMKLSRHFVPALHLPSPGHMVKPSGHLVLTLHLEPPGCCRSSSGVGRLTGSSCP